MGIFQHGFRPRLPVRVRASVFAVGRRVRVACPGDHGGRVAFTDDAGADALNSVADGTEVEILAWRPRSSGTRYRVRATNGLEGWLEAGSLRAVPALMLAAAIVPTPPATSSARVRTRKRSRLSL